MADNKLKCSNCNIVICEVLAFIQNKHDVMDTESIVRICVSAFSEPDIQEAKELLCDSIKVVVTKRKLSKRKDGKKQRDIEDILNLFKTVDPENLPIFVARDLQKLPPVLFDHVDVTKLLKDIMLLTQEVSTLKKCCALKSETDALRADLENLKMTSVVNYNYGNVNTGKRGAYCMANSGPAGFLSTTLTTESFEMEELTPGECAREMETYGGAVFGPEPTEMSPKQTQPPPVTEQELQTNESSKGHKGLTETSTKRSQSKERWMNERKSETEHMNESEATNQNPALHNLEKSTPCEKLSSHSTTNITTMADLVKRPGNWKDKSKEEKWAVVQRRRYRNRFLGNKGNASILDNNFVAAEKWTPLYISNVKKGTALEYISEYIKGKTGLGLRLEKLNMKDEKQYDSYRLFVPDNEVEKFLSCEFWPKGITFRKYVGRSLPRSAIRGANFIKPK